MSDATISEEDPAQPDVVALLDNGEAYSDALYPPKVNYHLRLEALRQPNVRFLVARDAAGRALATGALVLRGDWAEIKRIWVEPHARGRGLSKRVLDRLIATAREQEGVTMLRLEAGVHGVEALGLYEGAGFARRGVFGDYRDDPLSVFMERRL